jgi:hypothetical protein
MRRNNMTREEKIEKISRLVPQALGGDFKALAEEIVNALEEEEPEQYFEKEVVWSSQRLHLAFAVEPRNREKLRTDELAATVGARIEGAKWWSIDADGLMEWWKKEPAWFKQTSLAQVVKGWVNGGMVGVLRTNIRQEPEKGEL